MLRLIDVAVFCAPFAVYLLWLRFSQQSGPSPAMLALTLAGLALLGAGLVYFGLEQRLAPNASYVPAQVVNGQIVAGHAGTAPGRP
jgi:Family of unknown function (DUF6111)